MPQPFVFVLMPFSDEFTDIYEAGIKQACKDAGAKCERVDEQIFLDDVMERVYEQIAKADVIVAEMSGRNPNVFYETGYAHALKKRVILLTKSREDIPFDLKHFPHIIYEGKISVLKSQLEAKIKWCIETPLVSVRNEPRGFPRFLGTWKSIWIREVEDGHNVEEHETIIFDEQDGNRIYGRVMSDEPEQQYCVCRVEGLYNDNFLQIIWYPATIEKSEDLIDYGCYFLQRQPNGTFKGYMLGFYWHLGRIGAFENILFREN